MRDKAFIIEICLGLMLVSGVSWLAAIAGVIVWSMICLLTYAIATLLYASHYPEKCRWKGMTSDSISQIAEKRNKSMLKAVATNSILPIFCILGGWIYTGVICFIVTNFLMWVAREKFIPVAIRYYKVIDNSSA